MSFLKKVGKGLKKGVTKVYKPMAKIEKIVRPIGKKIPIVGTFAQLHEDITEPLERKVLGLKNKPNKSPLEKVAAIATSKDADIAKGIKANGKSATMTAINQVRANAARVLNNAVKTNPTAAKPLVALTKAALASSIVTRAKATGVPVSPAVAMTLKNAASALNVAASAGVYTVIKPDGSRVTIPANQVR